MSDTAVASRVNPWRALWFRPRAAIDAVIAGDYRTVSLCIAVAVTLLGALDAFPGALAFFTPATSRDALAFAISAALAVVVLAVVSYYLNGLILNAVAHVLRGRGSSQATRAASAWSTVPLLGANLLALAIATGVAGQAGGFAYAAAAAQAIASLWSFGLVIAMIARVQAFGWLRALVSVLIGSLLPALIIALCVRSFLFQPFSTPSGSMAPTLLVGDYFFAAKADYGYSRYSLPFDLFSFEGRLAEHPPKRGDVVVFRLDGTDYVKRIVGLPGEKIQLRAGRVVIDGREVERRSVEPGFALLDPEGKPMTAPTYDEVMPDGSVHRILQLRGDDGAASNTPEFEVPAGAYFVLGDNRDNSMDSRMSRVGFVPFENLIGRADVIYYSRDPDAPAPRLERMGTWVK